MDVYLCEKPSQGEDLAKVLGIVKKGAGYFEVKGGAKVTWAFGHLLELYTPSEYDPKYEQWSYETLPIIPETWKYRIKDKCGAQYKIIQDLVRAASTVYIATDYDREGESIARSLLFRYNFKGNIRRICMRALDPKSIRDALNSVKEGSETLPMFYAAIARQRADWLVGMNITRIYTLLAREVGYREVLNIGRVLSPTVALVCQRDNEIENFKPHDFWVLDATIYVQNGSFVARWVPPEQCCDENGRCINKPYAEQVASQLNGVSGSITKAETKQGKESAPLPFDLSSLQQYANKRWGYTAQETLDVAQALYETHKATSYPRTDCRYLPESQHEDVPHVFQSLMLSDQEISGLIAGANADRKGRAFNDAKVSAHHGIIPTSEVIDVSKLNVREKNIYDAIRRFYIAQFYSDYLFNRTDIECVASGHTFHARGNVPTQQGWRVLFDGVDESASEDGSQDDEKPFADKLPKVSQGEPAKVGSGKLDTKTTRPSPHYTEATLLSAMENVARFVQEEQFKKILKDTAGLGTPATRAGIIKGAVDRGFLQRKKNLLLSTDKARSLISVLPPALKSAGMTAAWEQELERIASGETSMTEFSNKITNWIGSTIEQLKKVSPALVAEGGAMHAAFKGITKASEHKCFTCGGDLRRIKGSKGFFWACQSDVCKKTFPDKAGKPEERIADEDCPVCADCGKIMRLRKGKPAGKKRATQFWGCTGYPECKSTAPYSKK